MFFLNFDLHGGLQPGTSPPLGCAPAGGCAGCISESKCDRYRGADKFLARPTSRCILFDGENISFDASLVICIKSTNIPPIMIINRKI